jgi:hypothetical protein
VATAGALEPDLRSSSSQPGAALHAFEVFGDVLNSAAPTTSPRAAQLCDWLDSISLPDGALPFALPIPDPAASASWWTQAASGTPSLQISAIVAAVAHQVARHDPAVAAHPWLARSARYCLDACRELGKEETPHAIVLTFALQFLDAVHDAQPEAPELLTRLGAFVPADGVLPVAGGTADEVIRPLDIAAIPDRPVRNLFAPDVIDADLRRLAAAQRPDGGWRVEYAQFSPAGVLDWRGHATVRAVAVLQASGLA